MLKPERDRLSLSERVVLHRRLLVRRAWLAARAAPEMTPFVLASAAFAAALVLSTSGSPPPITATAAPAAGGGPYGLAQTPAMGWRSWNAYHNSVTQAKMEDVMDAMTETQPGGGSLQSLGFESVGLDDEWQACGKGAQGSFHDSAGNPLWNNATFPDPAGMVAKAHSLQLKAGWYMNNCDCKESGLDPAFAEKIYIQSVKMLADMGWDGLKLDGCSQFHNTTKWATLMESTGRPMTIENCGNTHPPTAVPDPVWGHGGQAPYNWYRSSTDINPSWASIMNNLASTVAFQDPSNPLSKPGQWAYPEYATLSLHVSYCSPSRLPN
jgi:alpha-galactosidase